VLVGTDKTIDALGALNPRSMERVGAPEVLKGSELFASTTYPKLEIRRSWSSSTY